MTATDPISTANREIWAANEVSNRRALANILRPVDSDPIMHCDHCNKPMTDHIGYLCTRCHWGTSDGQQPAGDPSLMPRCIALDCGAIGTHLAEQAGKTSSLVCHFHGEYFTTKGWTVVRYDERPPVDTTPWPIAGDVWGDPTGTYWSAVGKPIRLVAERCAPTQSPMRGVVDVLAQVQSLTLILRANWKTPRVGPDAIVLRYDVLTEVEEIIASQS